MPACQAARSRPVRRCPGHACSARSSAIPASAPSPRSSAHAARSAAGSAASGSGVSRVSAAHSCSALSAPGRGAADQRGVADQRVGQREGQREDPPVVEVQPPGGGVGQRGVDDGLGRAPVPTRLARRCAAGPPRRRRGSAGVRGGAAPRGRPAPRAAGARARSAWTRTPAATAVAASGVAPGRAARRRSRTRRSRPRRRRRGAGRPRPRSARARRARPAPPSRPPRGPCPRRPRPPSASVAADHQHGRPGGASEQHVAGHRRTDRRDVLRRRQVDALGQPTRLPERPPNASTTSESRGWKPSR